MEWIIYIATNSCNGKIYIGQTKQGLEQRQSEHKSKAATTSKDSAFCCALRKYGFEAFKWEILAVCFSLGEANRLERLYIAEYKSQQKGIGYNIMGGGDAKECTPETREKLRLANMNLSAERRRKISEGQRGRIQSEATKKKLSDARKGVAFPEERKAKMRGKPGFWKGKELPEDAVTARTAKRNKPIQCIETGQVFQSIKQAKEVLGVGHIAEVLSGKYKHTHGLTFKYYNDDAPNTGIDTALP